jgi:uncharacterized protein (TIGR02246 family)
MRLGASVPCLWAACLMATCLVAGCASSPAPAPAPAADPPPVASSTTDEVVHEAGVGRLDTLDAVYRAFARGYRDLDPAAVAALYTEDARYLPAGPAQRGRDQILAGFERFFGNVREARDRLEITFRILDRTVADSGELVADVGIYTLRRYSAGEPEPGVSQGKFTVVAVRDDALTWRFHVDSFSPLESDPPP